MLVGHYGVLMHFYFVFNPIQDGCLMITASSPATLLSDLLKWVWFVEFRKSNMTLKTATLTHLFVFP